MTGVSTADPKTSYGYGYYCDSSLGPGWFRFQGSAGTRMTTSCTYLTEGVVPRLPAG